jgi:hypothetical protein
LNIDGLKTAELANYRRLLASFGKLDVAAFRKAQPDNYKGLVAKFPKRNRAFCQETKPWELRKVELSAELD